MNAGQHNRSSATDQPMPAYTVDQMKLYPWSLIPRSAKDICPIPTMLADGEIQLLYWMASEYCSGAGEIVDLGCFLGGSTLALGRGLQANSKRSRINTYDLFLCTLDEYSRGLIGKGRRPGDSTLDLFAENIAPISHLVDVHQGDVLGFKWSKRPIEILFVDIAKSWAINSHIIHEFFPSMIPGKTILIQQDYNSGFLPWIHITMGFFEDYFEYLCDHNGSRVYLYAREIPPDLLDFDLEHGLSNGEKLAILDRQIAGNAPYSAAMVAMSKAMYLFQTQGLEAALTALSPAQFRYYEVPSIPEQVEVLRQSITAMKTIDRYEAWHDKLFARQSRLEVLAENWRFFLRWYRSLLAKG